jgi:drug/metabolite transporter (DMT)-like permease
MFYYLSIVIVVLSNVFYHLASKKVPSNLNPFFFVMVSYVVGFFLAAVAFTVSVKDKNVANAFLEQSKLVNWAPIVLGIAVIGLEVGNVLMYRAGWDLSKGALVCNMLLAFVLILIGTLVFKEVFTIKHMAGIIACMIGLYLLA